MCIDVIAIGDCSAGDEDRWLMGETGIARIFTQIVPDAV